MQVQVHFRRQHAGIGEDAYVAVTIAPDGVEVPDVLNKKLLAKLGIEIRYFGQGYARCTGPRSKIGKALVAARHFAAKKDPQFLDCTISRIA